MSTEKYVWPAPLYFWLANIEQLNSADRLPKRILDCGAGGDHPPLGLFYDYGYQVFGIDSARAAIQAATDFGNSQQMSLTLCQADMRHIPIANETFSFVYEYRSLYEIPKKEVGGVIAEMTRVLRKGGYLFVSFTTDDFWPNNGVDNGEGDLCWEIGGISFMHPVYTDGEPEQYFVNLETVQKRKETVWLKETAQKMTMEEWQALNSNGKYSDEEWASACAQRSEQMRYTAIDYLVRKPLS